MSPDNAVSFVWDQAYQPDAVFTYTLTLAPEFADAGTGLPSKRTKFCKLDTNPSGDPVPTNCADINKQVAPKACLDTALSANSIPAAEGHPACIAREEWTTLPSGSCGPYSDPNVVETPACIRVTNRIIDPPRDPPIIRAT